MRNALADRLKAEYNNNFKPPKPVFKFSIKVDPDGTSSLEWNKVSDDWEITNIDDPIIALLDAHKEYSLIDDGDNFKNVMMNSYTIGKAANRIYVAMATCLESAILADKVPWPKKIKNRTDFRRHPAVNWVRQIMQVENEIDEKTADSIIKLYKLYKAGEVQSQIGLVLAAMYEKSQTPQ